MIEIHTKGNKINLYDVEVVTSWFGYQRKKRKLLVCIVDQRYSHIVGSYTLIMASQIKTEIEANRGKYL